MIRFNLIRGVVAVCALLTACVATEDQGANSLGEIPVIQLLCDTRANNCSAGVAYVGIIREMVDCEDHFYDIAPGERLADRFDAVGTASALNKGVYIEAFIGHFSNWANQSVIELPATNHRVCAFVDMNNNGHWEFPEPRAEGVVRPGGSQVIVDDWF